MTVVEQLYRLQRIDKALKEIEAAQLDQTELKRLVQLKQEEQASALRLGQLDWRLRGIKRQVSQGETEINEVAQKVDKYEEKLYDGSIQNSKELEHMKSNIDVLRAQQEEMEQTVIELMEEVEEVEGELTEYKVEHQKLQVDCDQLEKELKERLYKLRSDEKRFRGKREVLVNLIPEKLYQHYLTIYGRHDGLAVVRIRGNICSGCQVSLPAMVIDKVKQSAEPVHCEFCGRILFYKKG